MPEMHTTQEKPANADKVLANVEKATNAKIADLQEKLYSLDGRFAAKAIEEDKYREEKAKIALELEKERGRQEGFQESLDRYVNDTGDVPQVQEEVKEKRNLYTGLEKALTEADVSLLLSLTGDEIFSTFPDPIYNAVGNITTADGQKESIFVTQTVHELIRPLTIWHFINKVGVNVKTPIWLTAGASEGGVSAKAEGAAVEQIDFSTAQVDRSMTRVGVFASYTEDIMLDANQRHLLPYIMFRIMRAFENKMEDFLIKGDGSAPNPTGFLQETGIQTQTELANNSTIVDLIDSFADAKNLIYKNAYVMPNLIIVHPDDYTRMLKLKDDQDMYQHIFTEVNSPIGGTMQRLWGVPIIQSFQLTANEFVCMNTDETALYYMAHQPYRQREGYVGEDMKKNIRTIVLDTYANQFTLEKKNIVRWTKATS